MGGRHKGTRQAHQHRRHEVTTVGTQGTYTYDPGVYYVDPTGNGARHEPYHGNIPRYHDNRMSSKTSSDRSFEEGEGPDNAPRSRRRRIAITLLFILVGVIVLGIIAGVVSAIVDRDTGNDNANTTSPLEGDTSLPTSLTTKLTSPPTLTKTFTQLPTQTTVQDNTEISTKQTTSLGQSTNPNRQTVTSSSTPVTKQSFTPIKGSTPSAVSSSIGSPSTEVSTAITTTPSTVLTTHEQPMNTVTTDIITNSPNTVTTTLSTESTTRESCSNPGQFYVWILVDDNSDVEQIFSQIKDAMLPSDSICTVTNFGLIHTMVTQRRKRASEVGSLVIGIEVTNGEFTTSDVMILLTTHAFTGVDIDTVRIDDVSVDCILLGTTGSISEKMCRDLGFVYSELHDYESIDRIVWKGLSDYQEEYGNVSCDPASRDVAFCSVFYPDCKTGKQLCPGTCEDVKRNCPSVFESLSLPEMYCDRLPASDTCNGNIKNIPCDPQTQFKCPETELCISMTSLCDGNVDCLTSEIDEDETLCDGFTSTATPSSTKATSITPVPNECGDNEFGCLSTGDCIPDYWFCDDYSDCEDGSDEVSCACPKGAFRCEVSIPTVCIDEGNVCDNVADCADSSDESDCSGKTVECTENEFRCLKFPECIPSSNHCDGTADCQDKSDEWYDCPAPLTPPPITDFEVRLMQNATETTSELVGRVELREKGTEDEFGTICGDMWTQEDVNVLCRMLNSSFDGAAFAYTNAAFGEGIGDILLTNVDCYGNETNIGLCKSKRSNIHCSHQLDAAVSCGQYIDVPTQPTVETATVRLLNGGTCLEGIVQVYMRDDWRFVCDDRFDERDATVICRMLGFDSATGKVADFGIGDGVFWLDEVKCRGNETEISQCTYNEPGDHDCLYYEAVGVVCGGIPAVECTPDPDCLISSSCSFDTDDCCLGFPAPNINEGSTKWIRHSAGMIGYSDHTTGSREGGVIYYRNVFGSKSDMATVTANSLLKSNQSFSTETNLKLAFFYLVQSPHIGGLSVKTVGDGGSGEMQWSSPFLPQEIEGLWLYQCVDLPPQSITGLAFEGRRGGKADEIIAIDDVSLELGRCQKGLLHQECSFDDFGLCGEKIICDTCAQGDNVYRWRIISNKTDVRDNVQEPQLIKDNMQGGFMLADASYGSPSDRAVMMIDLEDGTSLHAVQFEYMVLGDGPNSLKVYIKNEENTQYLWQSQSVILHNTLQVGCIQLPTITTLTHLYIEAIRGANPFGDIALDNVRIVDRCQGFTKCVAGLESCNYTIESPMIDSYTWTEEDYVADGEIHQAYSLEDNSSPYGSWSRVITPDFYISNGQYQLSFSMLKQGTGTLKIYITNGLVKEELYMLSLYYTDDFEQFCITVNLTDMNGATLVLESVKGSLGVYTNILNDTEVVVVRDVDLKAGGCHNDSLLTNTCSFDDHLCVYEVEKSPSYTPCEPVYEWFRNGGSFNYNILKSDMDHSTKGINGRFISVVHQEGLQLKNSTLRFESMVKQDRSLVKAVSLYIRMYNLNLQQSDLFITVSGVKFDVKTHLLPLDVWQPVCIDVSDLQTGLIDVSITAVAATCDIDDVSLLNISCPGSVACGFDAKNNCGYTLENGWRQTDGQVQVSRDGSKLISPVLNTGSESCLEYIARSAINGSHMIRGKTQLLDKQTLSYIEYEEHFIIRQTTEWKRIQFQIPAVIDTVFAISFIGIGLDGPIFVDEITLTNYPCNKIICNAEEHACGNSYCISIDNVCDGMVDCPDGSDETNCDYCSHCYFKLYGKCICSFTTVNVNTVSGVNASSSVFELLGGKLISQVEMPLLNITVHSCLRLLGTYSDTNASLRIIRKDSYLLYPLATILDAGSGPGDTNISVTLDPGVYSLVFELSSLNPSPTGLALIIKDVEIIQGICEPDTISSTSIPMTTASIDNTTNNPGDDGEIKAYMFTDVTLACVINASSSIEETTLFWYKDGRQLTLNDDIVNQAYVDEPNGANIPKYTMSGYRDSNLLYMYNLIIKQVTTQDDGKYECKQDTPDTGILVENTFEVKVVKDGLIPTADGCLRNTIDTCYHHGFEAIQYEGPFGRQVDTQGLIFTLTQLENSLTSGQCKSAIESLTCSLFMPKCVNGSTIKMCKNYCYEIVSTCLRKDSDVYQLLNYGCDFLQNSVEHTCYRGWIGCGIIHNNQAGIIWSENYPEAYRQTNCSTQIHADKYHSLQLEFIEVDIGSGGGDDPCYFKVYDEDKDEVVLRRECGKAFDVDIITIKGGFVRVTFVSDGESQGRGYNIAYKQVLRYGCSLIHIQETSVEVTPDVLRERTGDRGGQCRSALLYTEDTRDLIGLDVNAVTQGCIALSSIDDNGDATIHRTICNSTESTTYTARGQVLMETDETALYSINARKKTYVRQVESISLDDDGRLVITLEEQFGIACVEVDQPTADIVCKSLNLGWPAKVTSGEASSDLLPSIVYNIACEGHEQQISDCRWSFENELKTCSRDTISLVSCKEVSLSCKFYESTCGYSISEGVQFSYEEGLVLQKPVLFSTSEVYGEISSPVFQYSDDSFVHFDYAVDADLGDKIIIELLNTNTKTSTVLWERKPFKVSGYLQGCFALPDIQDPEAFYTLTIKLSSPRSGFGYAAFVTAIRRLVISPEKCEGTDLPLVCSFENPDTCALMTDMEDMACSPSVQGVSPAAILTSAYLYRDRNWLEDSFLQRGEYNNYMLIDNGQDVTLLQNIRPDTVSLRFSYAVYLAPGITHLTWRLKADESTVLVMHDEQTDWRSTCVDIEYYTKHTIVLEVGDTLGNYNEFRTFSSLAIDDIQLSSDPCPHPNSCDFEDACSDHYMSVNGTSGWKRISSGTDGFPVSDVTYRTEGKGSFMVPDFVEAVESEMAVMETKHIGTSLQCLAFYLFTGVDSSSALTIIVNGKVPRPIKQYTRGEWLLYNLELSGRIDNVRFVATQGYSQGVLAIDDVIFTETACKDTLNNKNLCTFDNPSLCRMEAPYGLSAQFDFNMLHTKTGDSGLSKLAHDADGNLNGSFMFLKASGNDVAAEITFTVNTAKSAYRFWYYISSDATSNIAKDLELFTVVSDTVESVIELTTVNTWIMSPCFPVTTPFSGILRIGARIKAGLRMLVAIDNVELLDVEMCHDYSPACDFTKGQTCGYISEGQIWTHDSNSWFTIHSGSLSVPTVELTNNPHCFEFEYELYDVHTVAGISKLTLLKDDLEEIWIAYAALKMGDMEPLIGRVNIQGGQLLNIKFISDGAGIFRLLKTSLSDGTCLPQQDCDSTDEFRCQDKCIDPELVCNRRVECLYGEDETESLCGFKLITDFNTVESIEQSGFKEGTTSTDWTLLKNEVVTVNDKSRCIPEQTLSTKFNRLTISPAVLGSRQFYIDAETSCLYISYYGNVAKFTLSQVYEDRDKNVIYEENLAPSLSKRHFAVPVQRGTVQILLSVYMVVLDPSYRGDVPTSGLFGLYSFEIHQGVQCSDMVISCPEDIPNMCRNKMSCFTEEEKCNLIDNCMDKSDETDDCGYGIPCDFEHRNMCGYRNVTVPKTYWDDRDVFKTPQTLWERSYTNTITRPNFDHTFHISGKGHFMTSKNHEGLQDEKRYVDTEIMQSPYQTFNSDGCITFWYYLNSTAHQPKTGTAQLFLYIQYGDDMSKELLWYDHVNRPFTDWFQGGIPVQGNRNTSLVIKAVTFIPYDSWTGVVSVDDIGYHTGDCFIQRPECDDTMYRCDDTICIPHAFVCDGEADCHNGQDEQSCDRPEGGLQLVGGDGSYGQLGYFYSGQWRPVCYPSHPLDQRLFGLHAAHNVCHSLGFSGNSDAIPYRLWSKHSDTSMILSCDVDGECNATPTMENCDFYAYIKCSDEVCFSGETLCSGTISTCKPRYYFCDGETDCPGNTDEINCKCFEEEEQCIHIEEECKNIICDTCHERGMFECKNHQCIPFTERCDGVSQCGDGSDEYRCVQIDDDGLVTIFDRVSLQRKTVCVNDIDVEIAQTLCHLSGKGYINEILRGNSTTTDGLTLADSILNVQPSTGSCYTLKLICQLSECGTTSIQDSLVQSFVIHGRDTTIEEWPWYGALLVDGYYQCGAALISPEWVLTAAHCVSPGVDHSVIFGFDTPGLSTIWRQTIPVSRIFNNGYDESGVFIFRDISLLKLSQPVQINNYTRPICLPQQTTTDYIREMGTRAECYIVGIGATEKIFNDPSDYVTIADVLQKKRVQIVPNDSCEQEWRKGLPPTEDPFPENIYCIASEGPSSPSCFGDSGGPVMCKNARGRWELMGSVSFGYGNCQHDIIPSVVTSVPAYGEWIESVTGLTLHRET